MRKLFLIGHYPPPYGGISVHLKRLSHYLAKNKFDFELVDIVNKQHSETISFPIKYISKYWLPFYLFFKPSAVIHSRKVSFQIFGLLWLLSFRHHCVITIPNERYSEYFGNAKSAKRSIAKIFVRRIQDIICVSEKIKTELMDEQLIDPKKSYKILPSFLTPIPSNNVNNAIVAFQSNHDWIFSANASKLKLIAGKDLYGIDLLIKLIHQLNSTQDYTCGLILLIPHVNDHSHYEKLQREIEAKNLKKNILIITKGMDAETIWKASHIVFRPTITDGDANTIRESLALRIPTIASDCVLRPEGTILFKSSDQNDLLQVTLHTLTNYSNIKQNLENINSMGFEEKFIHFYSNICKIS